MISWGSFNWSMIWSSISFVGYIGNISSVMISSIFYVLTSSVGESNTVMSVNSFAVGGF